MSVRVLQFDCILFLLDRFDRTADQFGEVLLFIFNLILLDNNVSPGADLIVRLTLMTDQAILYEQILVLFSETFQNAEERGRERLEISC